MRRKLFTIASAVSLVLLMATIALWVRSYSFTDQLFYRPPGKVNSPVRMNSLQSVQGLMICARMHYAVADRRYYETTPVGFTHRITPQSQVWDVRESLRSKGSELLGFGYWRDLVDSNGQQGIAFVFPHWALALLFVLLPARWVYLRLRERRRRPGCCSHCGYDLRATPEPGEALLDRCPECGTEQETLACAAD